MFRTKHCTTLHRPHELQQQCHPHELAIEHIFVARLHAGCGGQHAMERAGLPHAVPAAAG